MGKAVKLAGKATAGPDLTINLFGPGMTALHKVGLAGLWMTLTALEKDSSAMRRIRGAGGSWGKTGTSVCLRWNREPEVFFKTLFQESFKIDDKGFLWFPAIGRPASNPAHSVILNEAILASHFQVPLTRGTKKQLAPISIVEDEVPHTFQFLPIEWISHQVRAVDLLGKKEGRVAGWVLPGASVRHEAHKDQTAHEEPPDRLLCLLYLPVGSVYFRVYQRRAFQKRKAKSPPRLSKYAAVVPEITDLEQYARIRRLFVPFGVAQLTVPGASAAAWRFAVTVFGEGPLSELALGTCRVFGYGSSPGTRQMTRVEIFTLGNLSAASLKMYKICSHFFQNQLRARKDGTTALYVPQVPDLVATNLAHSNDWWHGFSNFVADTTRGDHVFGFRRDKRGKVTNITSGERGGLAKMIEDHESFPDGPERIFVTACHQAWRRRLKQLFDKAKNERRPFKDLFEAEFVKTRVRFARCKNAASLREAVTDFWARSGAPLAALRDGWSSTLSLFDDKNWRKAKDLALLALASYKPVKKKEQLALESIEAEDWEEGKES